MNKFDLNLLHSKGAINEFGFHFANFIADLYKHVDPSVFLAAALVSQATAEGDVYLDLSSASQKPLFESQKDEPALETPALADWAEKLRSCPAVGEPGEFRPLIIDAKNRLYLYRYWSYEKKLSDLMIRRFQQNIRNIDVAALRTSLQRHFPQETPGAIDWQKVAVLVAVYKKICVISGGPGTGKTYTVAKILAVLLEQNPRKKLNIFLAAPTGKAAARLSESVHRVKQTLDCHPQIINAIPSSATTIHRMLKTLPDTPYFRHSAQNPLPADVVVVDEASMVDLALMSKLADAVPENARLILIGDKDQLASVEAGSVLGDICDRDIKHGFSASFRERYEALIQEKWQGAVAVDADRPALQDAIVVLEKSYRFGEDSPIGEFSRRLNRGNTDEVLRMMRSPAQQIAWQEIFNTGDFIRNLAKILIKKYSKYLETETPERAFQRFERFKILCAVNIGPFGVYSVNRFAEQILGREGLIRPDRDWYRGRPILITRNDYDLGLYNGDIGLTLPVPESSEDLEVYFSGNSGEFRRFPPYRLPEHETVYAMTVHKSQGSEFEDVLLILPDRDYPVMTRELLYTAITRARKTISIWGTEGALRSAISRKIERTSGLRDALWRTDRRH